MLGYHDQARQCNGTVSLSMAVQSGLLPACMQSRTNQTFVSMHGIRIDC